MAPSPKNHRAILSVVKDSIAKCCPFFIVGATASGKSNLAIKIASLLGGEIVNCDIYQAYRGLRCLSAAPTKQQMQDAIHHLYCQLPLGQNVSVGHYMPLAHQKICEISKAGKVPIVVGGSGMYTKSLSHGLDNLPAPDNKLREELSKISLQSQIDQLISLDAEGCKQIDLQNPRRVMRRP